MMIDAPKTMPPICSHGNYNRYKYNNTIEQRRFSATKHYFTHMVTIIGYVFFAKDDKILSRAAQNVACHACCCPHCFTVLASLFHLCRYQWISMDTVFFSMEEIIDISLLHTHFHVGHHFARLIFVTRQKNNYRLLVDSFIFCCLINKIK